VCSLDAVGLDAHRRPEYLRTVELVVGAACHVERLADQVAGVVPALIDRGQLSGKQERLGAELDVVGLGRRVE